jgi:ligand-binding sensor domain-containing protein/signal transduction histidine kinase
MRSHLKNIAFSSYILFFVLSSNLSFCQTFYFSHYQVENGLSNNAVMCSLQDQNGFMWFGTRDGLNRFDGVSFKIFRNNPNNPSSIGCNAIESLFEDKNKRLWIGTEKGIFLYDSQKEKFTQLKIAGNTSIRTLKVIDSNIWFISLYTLYCFNEKTGHLKRFKINKEVTSFCITKNNTLWVSTSAGFIAKYNELSESFTEFNIFYRSPTAESKDVESIFDTGSGILLIGTLNQGLKSFNTETLKYKDILSFNPDKSEIIVRQILPVSPLEYWIATQSGIYILNIQTGQYLNLKKEFNNPYSLSDNIVHTLCKDREGGIWAGTYFGGINYYHKQFNTFKKYYPKYLNNSISGNAVREICIDHNGNLWIGTEDAGLNKLDPITEKFTNYSPANNKNTISYSNIHGLLITNNELWVGTYLHGLDILNINTAKRIRHYSTANSSLGSNFIFSIYKTRDNQIIVATDKGLFQYLPNKNDFKLITLVPNYFFRTIYEDNSGTIWAGTYGDGIFYYNTKSGKHGQYLYESQNKSSLVNNVINKIYQDSKGYLWIATEGGLCKYLDNTKSFERYTTENGFPSDVIYTMLEDTKNNLWISTSKGLVCFSTINKSINVYTKSNGLITDQFNYNSACKDSKGQMYFGSVKGLITFHPDLIVNNPFSPPVFITGFQVFNKELLIDDKDSPLNISIAFTKEITLSNTQSSFSIDFAALSYIAPDKSQYAYKMDGLDKDWTYLKTNRKVYFTKLNPGKYTFKAKVLSSFTSKDGGPAELIINILPPFWKSWIAYLIYSILTILLSYLIIVYFVSKSRANHKRKLEIIQSEKEKENYTDKINFFINIAHEIRTPLTLIKGPMENIMESVNEVPMIKSNLEIMNKNTDKLLHLTNQILDFRKIEMNGFRFNFSSEDISKILLDQFESFKPIAEQQKKNITLDNRISIFAFIDLEAFNKIISNLLDNAVKYSHSKIEVILTLDATDTKKYTIIFKNDGYHIPEEIREKIFQSFYRAKETSKLPGTGIGLTLSRLLTEMHGGTLKLDNTEQDLNVFILTLPIHQNTIS